MGSLVNWILSHQETEGAVRPADLQIFSITSLILIYYLLLLSSSSQLTENSTQSLTINHIYEKQYTQQCYFFFVKSCNFFFVPVHAT